jgi:hypothetical protein
MPELLGSIAAVAPIATLVAAGLAKPGSRPEGSLPVLALLALAPLSGPWFE